MQSKEKKENTNTTVIAIRKSCEATGTGLSHYILMDKNISRKSK